MNIRYETTDDEKEKVLSAYFKEGLEGQLETFPSKEKRKLIILQKISERFEQGRIYSEIEINEVLKTIYGDFATIRRELIVYGFMNRSKNCAEYWIEED